MGPPTHPMHETLRAAGLTPREAEVFSLVADRLHNSEIAEALHVSERTVESHVSALLGKLHARNRLGLVETAARLRDQVPGGPALPRPLSSFVGRDEEVAEVVHLLASHRLVTLTGPAGAGKTRVALHVAGLEPDRPTALIDLVAASRPEDVERLFADSLAVADDGSRLRQAMRQSLRDAPRRLLVDNCERVAGAVAGLLADLLSAAPQLQVLATSLGPLRITGEAVYRLEPMPLPPDSSDPEHVLSAASARLFAERAATAAPGFEVTGENARQVAALCRRLDGLPLAIELAAARVRAFTPAELVARLDDRFALLTDGPAGGAGRHLTLEGAVRWSYELLDQGERILLERCSVFPADFDYDTAADIAAYPPIERGELVRLFPRLLDRSLISATRRGQVTSYHMLDSIREFARRELAARGEDERVREHHALHHLHRAAAALPGLQGRGQMAALRWFQSRWPDLRIAMRWALETGDLDAAWHFVAGVGTGWEIVGARAELFDWLTAMLEHPMPEGELGARASATAVLLLSHQDGARALAIAEDGYRRAAASGRDLALANMALGWARRFAGSSEPAVPHLEKAVAEFEHRGDRWHEALALQTLGLAVEAAGGDGLPSFERAAEIYRDLGDMVKHANCLILMASGAIDAAVRLDDAAAWLDEGRRLAEVTGNEHEVLHARLFQARLDQRRDAGANLGQTFAELMTGFQRIGDDRCVMRCLIGMGRDDLARGDRDTARASLVQAAGLAVKVGDLVGVATALRLLARLDHEEGASRRAANLLGAADAVAERLDRARREGLPPDADLRAALERKMERSVFLAAVAEGMRTPPAELLRA